MQVFNVEGMTCNHCAKAVTQAINSVDESAKVEIDLASGEVRIDSQAPAPELRSAIEEEGYKIVE